MTQEGAVLEAKRNSKEREEAGGGCAAKEGEGEGEEGEGRKRRTGRISGTGMGVRETKRTAHAQEAGGRRDGGAREAARS